jgi:hypothetical protein
VAATIDLRAQAARWRTDPVAFIDEVLRDPANGKPFVLYERQKRFLREAFALGPEGRLRCPEMIFAAPKKSGKTATAAMVAIYVAVVMAGTYGEVYCLANDLEQSSSRVFRATARIIEASPQLRHIAKITANRIEFKSTGTFIQAVASDYASFAGVNPSLCIFDELWAFTSDRARRLWDEALPSPIRKISGRLVVTMAGFEGESNVLAELYARGLAGEEIAPPAVVSLAGADDVLDARALPAARCRSRLARSVAPFAAGESISAHDRESMGLDRVGVHRAGLVGRLHQRGAISIPRGVSIAGMGRRRRFDQARFHRHRRVRLR